MFGWACCLVDVAVDLDTYEARVERCVHAVDVGKAINPVIVQGQIDGGTLQALGWALLENVVYTDGQVANANMTNLIVPTFADAPELETILVEVPYPHGPSGAKGVGEIPMDGPAAAVANAIGNALGGDYDAIPIFPEVDLRQEGDADEDRDRGQRPSPRGRRARRGSGCSTRCARTCGSPAPRKAAAKASAARAR